MAENSHNQGDKGCKKGLYRYWEKDDQGQVCRFRSKNIIRSWLNMTVYIKVYWGPLKEFLEVIL